MENLRFALLFLVLALTSCAEEGRALPTGYNCSPPIDYSSGVRGNAVPDVEIISIDDADNISIKENSIIIHGNNYTNYISHIPKKSFVGFVETSKFDKSLKYQSGVPEDSRDLYEFSSDGFLSPIEMFLINSKYSGKCDDNIVCGFSRKKNNSGPWMVYGKGRYKGDYGFVLFNGKNEISAILISGLVDDKVNLFYFGDYEERYGEYMLSIYYKISEKPYNFYSICR